MEKVSCIYSGCCVVEKSWLKIKNFGMYISAFYDRVEFDWSELALAMQYINVAKTPTSLSEKVNPMSIAFQKSTKEVKK